MKRILVLPAGRMANQMIQRIAANTIATQLKNAVVLHPSYAPWDLKETQSYKVKSFLSRVEAKLRPKKVVILSGNVFKNIDIEHKIIILGGNGLRLEYLTPSRPFARKYFPKEFTCNCCRPIPEELVLSRFNITHIRLSDIWNSNLKTSRSYFVLPISYYEKVYKISKKPFLLISESPTEEQQAYLQEIKLVAPGSIRLEDGCLIRDFQLLRNAENLTIATSTFSWLAAWLSESNKELFIPKAGLFDSKSRPDIDLISSGLESAIVLNVN